MIGFMILTALLIVGIYYLMEAEKKRQKTTYSQPTYANMDMHRSGRDMLFASCVEKYCISQVGDSYLSWQYFDQSIIDASYQYAFQIVIILKNGLTVNRMVKPSDVWVFANIPLTFQSENEGSSEDEDLYDPVYDWIKSHVAEIESTIQMKQEDGYDSILYPIEDNYLDIADKICDWLMKNSEYEVKVDDKYLKIGIA